MAYVAGIAAAAATSVALPAHQPGDIIIISASGTVAPSLPSGWTNIQSAAANSLGLRSGALRAFSAAHVSGTWLNATYVVAVVMRGSPAVGTAPAIETVIDAFDRANGIVNVGAGSTIWATGRLSTTAATNLPITGNQLGGTTWAEGYLQASYGPDIDYVIDVPVFSSTNTVPDNVFYFSMDGVSGTMNGNSLEIVPTSASVQRWSFNVIVNNVSTEIGPASNQTYIPNGGSIWIARRGSMMYAFRRDSAGGAWTLVTSANDATWIRAGRFGIKPGDSTNRFDNLRGGTVAPGALPELALGASSTGNGVNTTDPIWPALTLTRLDGTSSGVRAMARSIATDLSFAPTGWKSQAVIPAAPSCWLGNSTRLGMTANPAAYSTFLSSTGHYRAHTIEITEQPAPVPTWEETIDDFNRAVNPVYAGAVGSRVWNSTYITAIGTTTKFDVASNRLYSNSVGVNEAHTRVSLAASCDLIVDVPVAAALSGYLYLFFALSGAGSSNSATGYVLRVRNASATLDDWAIGTIVNGDYDNNMYVFANNVPKLPASGGIWISKRGQTINAYRRDSSTASWLRIINWTDNQYDRAGTVGIGVTQDQTVRIDNFRGGPLTWPPEYYPNQQTMMT